MLISRFLCGLSGSAFLSVAGGTVGDMFNREQLQAPMMIYTGSPFIGPVCIIPSLFLPFECAVEPNPPCVYPDEYKTIDSVIFV